MYIIVCVHAYMYKYIHLHIYIYTCTYIYVCKNRERERYIYIHILMICMGWPASISIHSPMLFVEGIHACMASRVSSMEYSHVPGNMGTCEYSMQIFDANSRCKLSIQTFFQFSPDSVHASPGTCSRSTRRRPARCSRRNSTRLCCPPQCVCHDQSGYNHVFVVDWC